MKKILLLSAFAMFSFYGFSQNALYGVRAGVNVSNLNYEPQVPSSVKNMHRNGFVIGFFAEYQVSGKLSFAPEIQFSAEGAKDESLLIAGLDEERAYSTRINYIQLPLFFKYQVSESIAIGLGPQASLKAHSYEDAMQNLAFSGLAGIEYKLSEEFFLDLRYSYGLTNVFDDKANLEAKNENLQIGFGLKF